MTTAAGSSPTAGPRQRRRPMSRLLSLLLRPVLNVMQDARRTQFAALGTPAAGLIVFLGDSITEGGIWDEWFPEHNVLNRGISGERSDDLLRRLDTAVNDPAAVVLLIGTNDLSAGRPIDVITQDVAAIIAGIHDRAPGTPVLLQSVMPRKAAFRDDVRALNDRYQALAATTPLTDYIDLWPALATPQGTLRPEMTRDKLHLTGAGYRAWTEVLRPLLAQLDRKSEAEQPSL